MNKKTTISLLAVSLLAFVMLGGCEKDRQELEQARTDARVAEDRCRELEAKLTEANEQLTAVRTQLAAAEAASQVEINSLKEAVKKLTADRDTAMKSADQAAMNQLKMLLQIDQQEKEYKAQIEALTEKLDELAKSRQ